MTSLDLNYELAELEAAGIADLARSADEPSADRLLGLCAPLLNLQGNGEFPYRELIPGLLREAAAPGFPFPTADLVHDLVRQEVNYMSGVVSIPLILEVSPYGWAEEGPADRFPILVAVLLAELLETY